MPRLSLIVITKNEELQIERCLRSASFADEMVVVDNGSTDKTVEIARSLGAKVIETKDWPGFGAQKNRALAAASGEWILSLDADEWIENLLAEEIKAVLNEPQAAAGYMISRRSRFCGKIVGHCGWSPDYVLRLWKRGEGRFIEARVHEHVRVNGKIGYLKNPIEHDAIADLADARDKARRYSDAAAVELAARGKKSSKAKAFVRAAGAFFRTYILRAGFLDGVTGWRVARYNTDYTYQKWSKVVNQVSEESHPGLQLSRRIRAARIRPWRYLIRRLYRPRALQIGNVWMLADRERMTPRVVKSLYHGDYEAAERLIVEQVLKPGDRVLEGGAGMGLISITAAKIVGAENVVSYEPVPAAFSFLNKNLELNKVQIDRRQKALGAKSESKVFYVDADILSSNSVSDKATDFQQLHVQVDDIRKVLSEFAANVLILDIEGAETEVFSVCPLNQLNKIIIETHPNLVGDKATDEIFRILADGGLRHRPELSHSRVHAFIRDA